MNTIPVLIWADNDYDPPKIAITHYLNLQEEDNNPVVDDNMGVHILNLPIDTPIGDLTNTVKIQALIQGKKPYLEK